MVRSVLDKHRADGPREAIAKAKDRFIRENNLSFVTFIVCSESRFKTLVEQALTNATDANKIGKVILRRQDHQKLHSYAANPPGSAVEYVYRYRRPRIGETEPQLDLVGPLHSWEVEIVQQLNAASGTQHAFGVIHAQPHPLTLG